MSLKSQTIIRDMNYHRVLETIINKGRISRVEIARKLGLTKATISSLVNSLLEEHLITEVGRMETAVGRRPIQLAFQASYGYVISIDIRMNTINFLLSNMLGQRCILKQLKWNNHYEHLEKFLPIAIKQMMQKAPHTYYGLIGISLAIHGIVYENNIEFTPYYQLEHTPLHEMLSSAFKVPVFLGNEANLAALGDQTFSFQSENMINVSVHSGIGLGVIVKNELYVGKNGFAGEFGHTIVKPSGIPCPCGNNGCIEQYASEKAIINKYNLLTKKADNDIETLIQAYHQKETAATCVMDDFLLYMSIGINNIINIFNPELIVINSVFTSYLPDLIDKITSNLKNNMDHNCKILSSPLQDAAALLGGVHICTKKFLNVSTFSPPLIPERQIL